VNLRTTYNCNSDLTIQKKNMQKRVNEDVIDYDLIEDLICYIDESCGEGAILVFLPVRLFGFHLSRYAYLYFLVY